MPTSPQLTSLPPPAAFIVVKGRRWRTSDPHIPPTLRQELVDELMAARRAVADAKSDQTLLNARRRVQDAKMALGERGRGWWLPPTSLSTGRRIEATIMALLRSRRAGASICPSDVARSVGGTSWRSMLPIVRDRAARMSRRGRIDVLRRGCVVTRNATEGVLRYRLREGR